MSNVGPRRTLGPQRPARGSKQNKESAIGGSHPEQPSRLARAGRVVRSVQRLLGVLAGERFLAVALAGTAIAIAALGQALTTRTVPDSLDWLTFLAGSIDTMFGRPESVSAGAVLLVAGAVLYALAAADRQASDASAFSFAPLRWAADLRSREGAIVLGLSAVGIGLFAFIIVGLATQPYQHWLAILFPVALVLMAVPFFWRDRNQGSLRVRLSQPMLAEAGFLVVVIGAFIALNIMDLTSWKYAAVGDEYDGFRYAKRIAAGNIINPFSQRMGVEGIRPVLGSMVDAAFLKAFGGDLFAWKVRLVVLAAASFVPFYLLVRELFSCRVAIAATALFASSHYLFAYVHHPTYIDALLPTTLALWLLVLGLRRNSTLVLFASGAAAGLGFYTFYAGRAAVVVIALYLLTFGRRSLRPTTVLPLGLGFIALVAPMFAVDGWYVVDRMFESSTVAYPEEIVGPRATRFLQNIVKSLLAFNYSESTRHYVSGSLLDPVTAVLYVLGLGLLLTRLRHPAFRLVLIWWLVALAATGFTNPYKGVAISRLHYVIPVAALLAALAFDQGLRPTIDRLRRPAVRVAVAGVALGLLMVPVLYLNLHRFWYETPHEKGAPSAAAVAVRAFFSDECRDNPQGVTVVSHSPTALLLLVFWAYQLGDREPELLNYPDALAALDAKQAGAATLKDGCFIVLSEGGNPELPKTVIARIQALYPQKRLSIVTDLAERHKVSLIH